MIRRIFTSCKRQIYRQRCFVQCNQYFISMRRMTNFQKYTHQYSQDPLYHNLNIDAFKSMPSLTFKDIVSYSRAAKYFGKMTDDDESPFIESSNYLRKNLATIIARTIIDFQNLPYGVAQNPRIQQIMETYIESYTAIKQTKNITSIQQKNEFHQTLQKYIANWSQICIIPTLCLGLLERAEESSSNKIKECPYLSTFLERIITRKLAVCVLLGHYAALYDHQWGIFEEDCQIMDRIEAAKEDAIKMAKKLNPAAAVPMVNISDMRKHDIPFVFNCRMIHQFCFELIKNAIRATMESNYSFSTGLAENAVNIIVVNSKDGDITIKIEDTGGGISRDEMEKIWLYSYTAARNKKSLLNGSNDINGKSAVNGINGINGINGKSAINGIDGKSTVNGKSQMELLKQSANLKKSFTHNPYYIGVTESDMIPMHGLGYGLPLVKAYSEYFGGSCKIRSIDGYGTDAYLFLPSLDRSQSNVLYAE